MFQVNVSSSSDEDELFIEAVQLTVGAVTSQQVQVQRPILSRAAPLARDRIAAHELLVNDYFSENPTYTERLFRRRFRMSRNLFIRICNDLEQNFAFFQQRYDGRMKLGFSPFQKCTSAVRQLAYGTSADSWDEYLQMSDRTSRECLYKFSKGIVRLYGEKYLRKPNSHDVQQLYSFHEDVHGLPGMLGSLDCMHWEWENCPTAWRGQFQRGDHPAPTIMLEAVASQDLWIWHAFFGAAGSNNDINVLDQSPLFNDLIEGRAPGQSFICNDTTYEYGYYLVDGIYPQWATFVKSFTTRQDQNEKRFYFQKRQESARKDIERAFGVLKRKWHIIKQPARPWLPKRIRDALYCCVILHNMIIEDNGRAICEYTEEDDPNLLEHMELTEDEKQTNRQKIRDEDTHANLKADLIEHIWRDREV